MTQPCPADDHGDFTLYFLAFDHSNGAQTEAEKKENRLNREGILELTHNHGTEHDADFSYASGNSDPRGFGHIAITVDDVGQACARLEGLGVPFQKRLSDGTMRDIAFAKDPDGYVWPIQSSACRTASDLGLQLLGRDPGRCAE